MRLFFIIILFGFTSCKTSTTIDPPEIQEVEDPIEIQDDFKPLGNDQITGQVKDENNANLQGVPIKLTLNGTTCVNSYSDFDGLFSMNDNSYIEFVFRDYVIKKIDFKDFPKNGEVRLDKKRGTSYL